MILAKPTLSKSHKHVIGIVTTRALMKDPAIKDTLGILIDVALYIVITLVIAVFESQRN
jgi:hypothetical protein